MELTVKCSRNLNKLIKQLNAIDKEAKKIGINSSADIAKAALAILKGHIENQDLPWKKLSESWLYAKIRQGLSEDIYVATGEFLKGLRIKKVKDRNIWRIGAFKEDLHKPSGLSMAKIAKVLEYGLPERGLPPRPLFRPSQKDLAVFIRTYIKVVGNKIRKMIKEKLRI